MTNLYIAKIDGTPTGVTVMLPLRSFRLLCFFIFFLPIPALAQSTQEDVNARVFQAMQERVAKMWEPPGDAHPQGQVVLAVQVSPGGAFRSARVITTSGDNGFDMSAIKAVSKAFPLPMWQQLNEPSRQLFYDFNMNLGKLPSEIKNLIHNGTVSAVLATKTYNELGTKAIAILQEGVEEQLVEGKKKLTPSALNKKRGVQPAKRISKKIG